MPDWYPLVRAARLLGVAPWELARQPTCWLRWALDAEVAESAAEEMRRQIAEQDRELKGKK